MTRKRSKYRPRGINPRAHLVAMMGVSWLSQDDQVKWALAIDDAVRAVARGQASQAQWREIFDAVNLVEQLVIMRKAHAPGRIVQAAQDACVAILDRQRETGVRAARASELAALHELRAGWVELMSGITQAERFAAGEAVQHRVRRALAGAEPAARLVQPLEQEPA
ncbi:MAG: hypothetical protein ACK52V_13640 [Betaproteobacteria bacterium]